MDTRIKTTNAKTGTIYEPQFTSSNNTWSPIIMGDKSSTTSLAEAKKAIDQFLTENMPKQVDYIKYP